jgi:sugar/nucleoside kinase (ribokinase family)
MNRRCQEKKSGAKQRLSEAAYPDYHTLSEEKAMSEVWTMGELLVEIMRPRAGMTLYEPGEFRGPFPSGAPGIFIDTVARLGHSAAVISGVGEDDFGRCLLDRFERDGVRTDFIEVFPNRSTGVAFVTYFEDGSRKYIFHWDGTPAVMAHVPSAERIRGAGPKYFHVMDCSLMANEEFRQRVFDSVELFAAEGAQVTFDPNIRFELLGERTVEQIVGPILRRCSILFPGENELLLLGGHKDVETASAELFQQYPLDIIVLKQGSRGCTVYTQEGKERIPAFNVTEIDPTGAGDCFDAGFLCGQLEGQTLAESARLAAAVGALDAQAFGPMEGQISRETAARLLEG